MDESRGTVASSFPIAGCISGGGFFLRNTLSIPIAVDRSGDTGAPSTAGVPENALAAAISVKANGGSAGLIVPGQIMFIPVGGGAASVTVRNQLTAAATYIVADGLLSVIPLGKSVAVEQLFAELTNVYLDYRDCVAPGGLLRVAGCGVGLGWDVSFAAARAGLSLAPHVVDLAVAAIKQLKFTAGLQGELNKVSAGQRSISLAPISVAAAPKLNCSISQPASTQGVTRSQITFVNASGVTIDVFWLNYAGSRVFYYTLPAGKTYIQQTWLTHPWVAVDKSGVCHGYTLSDTLSKTYTIP